MGVLACQTPQSGLDYVLADQAFRAAKEVDAARYSPAYFHKAEESFRKGVTLYNSQKYGEANGLFQEARSYAEKAENAARLQRQKSGDEGL